MNNFRKFGTKLFNIDDISLVDAVQSFEEWGDDVEEVQYMLIVLKSGVRLRTFSSVYHKFNGSSKDYLEHILNAPVGLDVNPK